MKTNILDQFLRKLELDFAGSSNATQKRKGVIVTISREYGSAVRKVGQMLVNKLNQEKIGFELLNKKWILIDTSVIRDLSQELSLDYKAIEEYVPQEKKGLVEQIIHSFSPDYNKLDGHLDKALETVLNAYFDRGNVVILGRGAEYFASELQNALRIKINSTFQFRIAQIMDNHGLSYQDAKMKMLKNAKLRNDFLEHIKKGKPDTYTSVIDRSRLDDNTLADYLMSFTSAKVKDIKREIDAKKKMKVVH
ncbi:cytidylate kinase-like family protein [Flammeovirga sp. MY04]|uniref:cytidylate kinase-like family protein n=1 Tax=Flammeovirga sp. MY04 TaxID=1191459 RepID=UPI00080632DE|nr:cytidylate kinase-like family protein [Flammeovirga sp. MY04]ANQ49795.1 cytidylate kinase-like family protein [Flammeovirga sp. MY04]